MILELIIVCFLNENMVKSVQNDAVLCIVLQKALSKQVKNS